MMMTQLATVAIRARIAGLARTRTAEIGDPLEQQVAVVRQRCLELVELGLGDVGLEVRPEDQVGTAGVAGVGIADRRPAAFLISNRDSGIGDLRLFENLDERGGDDLRRRLAYC